MTVAAGSTRRTRVYEGGDPEAVIADMLADPEVEQIHSRNIAYGCYMFTIRRPDSP